MPAYNNYTPYYGYAYQPQQVVMPQPQPQQPTNGSSINWVRNQNEAMMFPVAPNAAVALWDSSSPVIYLKQADASGKPSMKIYDLVERIERPVESTSASPIQDNTFATKKELEAVVEAVKGIQGEIDLLRNKKKEVKKDE